MQLRHESGLRQTRRAQFQNCKLIFGFGKVPRPFAVGSNKFSTQGVNCLERQTRLGGASCRFVMHVSWENGLW